MSKMSHFCWLAMNDYKYRRRKNGAKGKFYIIYVNGHSTLVSAKNYVFYYDYYIK